jgi:hypothetical protein
VENKLEERYELVETLVASVGPVSSVSEYGEIELIGSGPAGQRGYNNHQLRALWREKVREACEKQN